LTEERSFYFNIILTPAYTFKQIHQKLELSYLLVTKLMFSKL